MFRAELPQPNDIRQQIRDAYRADEEAAVERLIEKARLSPNRPRAFSHAPISWSPMFARPTMEKAALMRCSMNMNCRARKASF